jgi:thiamine pyrophosphokinase
MTIKKRTVVIFAGGEPPPPSVLKLLPDDAFVIAADSGFDHARQLGEQVDLLVGDMDSISREGLAAATEIERHSIDKDATDLELAMRAAARRQPDHLIVVGGEGGRIDHFLANACLLAAPEVWGIRDPTVDQTWVDLVSIDLMWLVAGAVIHVVRVGVELAGAVGDIVSLLPFGGPAAGVTTDGLRWPLSDALLATGTTRGVSNEMASERASVTISSGTLLVAHVPTPVA